MDVEFVQLVGLLSALWWPFCRVMAMLSAAPLLGEAMVPVTVRVLLSLALAVVLMPISQSTALTVNPWSLQGVAVAVEQAMLGFVLGLAFHLTLAVINLLGFLLSSQLGLALPVIFSTLLVQIGLGWLNRVAPSLNLFSLGFSVVTLFGLFMLSQLLSAVPAHYLRLTERVLELIDHGLKAGVPGHV